ncbi:MAG: glycosyltransferase [Armatimonadetes bacterium]|nr:glycosyltransferase [Armatimonadota bacterium]
MSPLVSVIIPTFNAEAKLAVSLTSVLEAQTPFSSLEVLVMDGASTDNTLEIARQWAERDSRVKLWSEPDAGIFDGMNKGIARARGQILYFMGAGDVMRPGVLSELEKLPNLHPLLLLHGQVWHEGANVAPDAGADLKLIDLARYDIPHQGAFYGREVFQTVGLYNTKYRIYADRELNWRCWTTPQIEKRFWSRIVADFELGGASSSLYDPEFKRDWPRLVWQRGGPLAWASFQISRRCKPEQMVLLRKLRALLRRRGVK